VREVRLQAAPHVRGVRLQADPSYVASAFRLTLRTWRPPSGGPFEKRAREAFEQLRQPLAVEREGTELRRPREFIASCHRRDPDLAHGCIWRHDEFRLARLLEDEVQHAVLELDFEALAVRQWQKRTACGVERFVALHAEFLLGDGRHGPIK